MYTVIIRTKRAMSRHNCAGPEAKQRWKHQAKQKYRVLTEIFSCNYKDQYIKEWSKYFITVNAHFHVYNNVLNW